MNMTSHRVFFFSKLSTTSAMASSLALKKLVSSGILSRSLRLVRAVAQPASSRLFNSNAVREYDNDERDFDVDRRLDRRVFSPFPDFFSPFSPRSSLSQILNMMDQFMESPVTSSLRRNWDVKETADSLQLCVDMPGLTKDEVKVSVEQSTLVIKGKGKKESEDEDVPCETDQLSHVYTFILRPDATYNILIDNVEKQSNSLYSDWDLLPPKKIKDPDSKKIGMIRSSFLIPKTRNQRVMMTSQRRFQMLMQKRIGMMRRTVSGLPPLFPTLSTRVHGSQDFKDDPDLYVFPTLKYVGIELWQVKSGTLFDNILVSDDPEYAQELAEETWGKHKDAENAAFDEAENKRKNEIEWIKFVFRNIWELVFITF